MGYYEDGHDLLLVINRVEGAVLAAAGRPHAIERLIKLLA
jgi:hypothetical protein